MTPEPNGTPSTAEMARRLERLEGRLDARTLNVDVYQAEKMALMTQIGAVENRVKSLEESKTAMTRMVMTAFAGILVQVIIMVIQFSNARGR